MEFNRDLIFFRTLHDSYIPRRPRGIQRGGQRARKFREVSQFQRLVAIRSALKGIITYAGSLRLVISRKLTGPTIEEEEKFLRTLQAKVFKEIGWD